MSPILNRDLFNVFLQSKKNTKSLKSDMQQFFLQRIEVLKTDLVYAEKIERWLRTYICNLLKFWQKCKRSKAFFQKKHSDWLGKQVTLPPRTVKQQAAGGRPPKRFEDSSLQSKRRKVSPMLSQHTTESLVFALCMKLRKDGHTHAAALVEKAVSSPSQAQAILALCNETKVSERPFSPEEAVSLLIELDLTKQKYITLRTHAVSRNSKLFPSYKELQSAKKKCAPTDVIISEKKTEVSLQAIVDHTSSRLVELQDPVVCSLTSPDDTSPLKLELRWKWGFDGSSGFSEYQQQTNDKDVCSSSIFLTSAVPLQMRTCDDAKVVWNNPRPSSPTYCRPIRLQMIKETEAVSRAEQDYVQNNIDQLQQTVTVSSQNRVIHIKHIMHLTMIDGKVRCALAGVSTQRCPICGAFPREMNKLNVVQEREVDPFVLDLGLSPLHARIRFFENILHIAYKLTLNHKEDSVTRNKIMAERKKMIQDKFKSELSLDVDKPKQNLGNTNSGNTARKFFDNAATSAAITGVDEQLISRMGTILSVMNSRFRIDADKFGDFCLVTYKMYVDLYPWYKMPPALHLVLLHGKQVISSSVLSIGEMSEEAQETLNKFIKRFREHHTRKSTRLATNEDLMKRLLVASDPICASQRTVVVRNRESLSADMRELLLASDDGVLESDEFWFSE